RLSGRGLGFELRRLYSLLQQFSLPRRGGDRDPITPASRQAIRCTCVSVRLLTGPDATCSRRRSATLGLAAPPTKTPPQGVTATSGRSRLTRHETTESASRHSPGSASSSRCKGHQRPQRILRHLSTLRRLWGNPHSDVTIEVSTSSKGGFHSSGPPPRCGWRR